MTRTELVIAVAAVVLLIALAAVVSWGLGELGALRLATR